MSKLCFSYPAAAPASIPSREAAQAARRDLRRMPNPCYSYPDVPQGGRDPGAAQPSQPGLRRMPMTCFRY
jgi:hypothetical protein